MPSEGPSPAAAGRPLVACLCAAWCGTCRDYRAVFDAAAAQFADHAFVWIDIEDESALFDDIDLDLDIETFPTVAVVHGGELRFFGPLLPGVAALTRIVDASRAGVQGVAVGAQDAAVLARKLAQRGASGPAMS